MELSHQRTTPVLHPEGWITLRMEYSTPRLPLRIPGHTNRLTVQPRGRSYTRSQRRILWRCTTDGPYNRARRSLSTWARRREPVAATPACKQDVPPLHQRKLISDVTALRTAAPKAVTAASPPATSRPLIGERGAMERQGLGRTSRERPVTVEWKGDEEAGSKEDEANVSSTLNVQSKDIHAGSPPEKPSTEYPQIMMNVAAICTKEEDESPVVIAAVSGMTLDELIERHPGLTLNCGSSQEKYESLWLNVNKNLDDIDKEPGISWALRFIPEQNEEGGRGLKATETVEVRNDVGVNTEPQLVKMETVVEEPPIDALFPIKVSVLPAEEARRVFYMNQNKRASSNQEDRVDVRKGPASQLVAESQHKAATEEVTSCNGVVTKSDCPQYQKVTPHQEPHHEELMEDESPQEKHLMRKDGEEKGGNGDRSGTRSEPPCSAAKPAPAGTASPLDVSETLSSFPEAKTTRGDDRVLTPAEADAFKSKDQVGMPKTSVGSAPSLESESEREPSTPQSRRRSSTFETEDSADYSDSSPKFNFLTVSSQSWDRRRRRQNSQRARARPRSDSEKEVCKIVTGESEDDECTRKVKKSRKRGLPTTSESEGDSDESGYVGNKAGLVHIRRKTKRQNIAKRKLTSSDSDVKAESDQCRKKERKGLSSNGSEETDNSSAPQKRPSPVPMKEHCEHDSKRPQQTRMSSGVEMENNAEDATVLQHHPVDREGKSVSALNHMVPRLIGQTSLDPADPLKLPKENTLHKHREAGTRVSKAEIKTGQEKDSSREKLVLQSLRDEGRRSVSPGEEAADSKAQQKMKKSKDEAQATLRKRTPTLREHLPSAQKGQLISGGSQASTIETLKSAEGSASVTGCPSKCSDGAASSTKRLSHSKQGSASSRKHSSHSRDESACPRERSLQSGGEAAVSRKNASESKRGSSNSSEGSSSSRVHLSSSSKNPSGERSSTSTTTMTSARKQVTSQWLACHVPTRVYRRPSLGMDEDSGTSPTRIRSERGREHRDARGEVGPGPRVNDSQPRQRHNSYESARPLMKRSMDEAKQWMMATHREAPHEQRTPVGEGYKWAEKSPTLSKNRSLNSQRRYNRSLSSPFR
ncbi:uncharacterized protein ACJ7VT_010692 [Polymixia lowei]